MDHAPATDRSPGPVAAFIGSFPGLLVCLAAAALGLYLLITEAV